MWSEGPTDFKIVIQYGYCQKVAFTDSSAWKYTFLNIYSPSRFIQFCFANDVSLGQDFLFIRLWRQTASVYTFQRLQIFINGFLKS